MEYIQNDGVLRSPCTSAGQHAAADAGMDAAADAAADVKLLYAIVAQTSCPMPLLLKQAFAPGVVIAMPNRLEFDTNPHLATLKFGEQRISATVSECGRVYAWLSKAEACLFYGGNKAIITVMVKEATSMVLATPEMEDVTMYQVLVGHVPHKVDVPDVDL